MAARDLREEGVENCLVDAELIDTGETEKSGDGWW